LTWWEEELIKQGKIVESQRLHQRTMYDLEMIKEMGFCRGIENYSRHLTGKPPGAPPPTLLHYLHKDTIIIMTNRTRRFRKSARCIKATARAKRNLGRIRFSSAVGDGQSTAEFAEFEALRVDRRFMCRRRLEILNSSKPAAKSSSRIIRPTGLLDPVVEVVR
jgi:excinuclease ABC subunit B